MPYTWPTHSLTPTCYRTSQVCSMRFDAHSLTRSIAAKSVTEKVALLNTHPIILSSNNVTSLFVNFPKV